MILIGNRLLDVHFVIVYTLFDATDLMHGAYFVLNSIK
jgi:hypothetical protein